MAEIATWSAILNKTGLGKTSNECPTKAELLALNNGKDSNVDKVIVISNAASYGNNECVKLEDINAEQWIYTFQWDPMVILLLMLQLLEVHTHLVHMLLIELSK